MNTVVPLHRYNVGGPQPTYALRQKLWHEHMIDLLIQNPRMTIKELAAAVGKKPDSVSMIMRSNMFEARLELRRQEHAKNISHEIIAKQQRIVGGVLDQLQEKIEENAITKKISARDLSDIAGEMLDRIGLGAKAAEITVNTNVQQNNVAVTVSSDALQRARSKLRHNEAMLIEDRQQRPERDFVDVIVDERARDPILDELMSIGDEVEASPEGEKSPVESAAPAGRGEGEG